MQIVTGTSGWSYAQWEEAFYPKTYKDDKLAYYARHFDAVELNLSLIHI